jgi:hypothetical protein
MRDARSKWSALPVLALLFVLVACTSAQSGEPVPTVTISQSSAVEPLLSAQGTGVPVEYRLDVINPLDHAITLTMVELETIGSAGGYQMKRVRHAFTEVIAAKGAATVPFRAWVQPLQVSDKGRVLTPVMIRGSASFDSRGSTLKSPFAATLKAVDPSR